MVGLCKYLFCLIVLVMVMMYLIASKYYSGFGGWKGETRKSRRVEGGEESSGERFKGL